ncbi:MAG TPA: IS200/IS605 family transposase [Bacteroidales bacterium]|nr:IS200/IS605 family transposase [Bacteroidales bacterium]
MSSYRKILYHIIFRPKMSERVLTIEYTSRLYEYISGIIKNKKCYLYQINGTEDHIHLLSDLHPSLALADYIREIKTSSSIWLKSQSTFPKFKGWADGYAAVTCSYSERSRLIEYIKNQREHHKKVSFEEEYRAILNEYGIKIDERYFP